jgi:DnaJ-domain-containing protein 1
MEISDVEEKLSNMHFDDIVKSYCNKLNYIEKLKEKIKQLENAR